MENISNLIDVIVGHIFELTVTRDNNKLILTIHLKVNQENVQNNVNQDTGENKDEPITAAIADDKSMIVDSPKSESKEPFDAASNSNQASEDTTDQEQYNNETDPDEDW